MKIINPKSKIQPGTRGALTRNHKGFTLIEILVSIAVLGILMASLMVAFNQANKVTISTQEEAEVMQNIRSATEQFNRELSQAIINNNRPDGEQVYFEIKQLSREDSALRFGCTTERGLVEIGYEIKPSEKGWKDYELWRLYKNKRMWNYSERNWPALNFESKYVEPFAFGIVAFKVKYWSSKKGRWIGGNWESIDRNSLPRKIQITLKTLTKSKARAARNVEKLSDVRGVKSFKFEINLPQAR